MSEIWHYLYSFKIPQSGMMEVSMDNQWIAFGIWCAMGVVFMFLSMCARFSKKPMRFWANADLFEVSDVKKYNDAVAKLFCVFGIIWIFLGIPLVNEQNSAWILLSIVGAMIESIGAMVVYSLVIERKYKKGENLKK